MAVVRLLAVTVCVSSVEASSTTLWRQQVPTPVKHADPLLQQIQRPSGFLPGDAAKLLLETPRYAQDPLLRQLLAAYSENFHSSLSPPSQAPQADSQAYPGLSPPNLSSTAALNFPSHKQHRLRTTQSGGRLEVTALQAPSARQDPLLRQLSPQLRGPPRLSPPSQQMVKSDRILNTLAPTFPGIQPRQKTSILLREHAHRQHQDNSLQTFGDSIFEPLAAFQSDGKSSSFQSLVSGISKAMEIIKLQQKEGDAEEILSLGQGARVGPQSARQTAAPAVPGGVDFSQATRQPDGRMCVVKEERVETVDRSPVLKCSHTSQEKCHFTYLTIFSPAQEEKCDETFEKKCQISFRPEASSDTVRKCLRPLEKFCTGQGPQRCRTEQETSCTTTYREDSPGRFLGDTRCSSLPVEVCGAGCVTEEGEEECHDKQVDSLVDVPEEVCDLVPQKVCRLVTRLVPSLSPSEECTQVPREVCTLQQGTATISTAPLRTEWCLEPAPGLDARLAAVSLGDPEYRAQLLDSLRRLRRDMAAGQGAPG